MSRLDERIEKEIAAANEATIDQDIIAHLYNAADIYPGGKLPAWARNKLNARALALYEKEIW